MINDFISAISQHVTLEQRGRSFHDDKHQSFHVFPDRQTWRCFGACAIGGDLAAFTARIDLK